MEVACPVDQGRSADELDYCSPQLLCAGRVVRCRHSACNPPDHPNSHVRENNAIPLLTGVRCSEMHVRCRVHSLSSGRLSNTLPVLWQVAL